MEDEYRMCRVLSAYVDVHRKKMENIGLVVPLTVTIQLKRSMQCVKTHRLI